MMVAMVRLFAVGNIEGQEVDFVYFLALLRLLLNLFSPISFRSTRSLVLTPRKERSPCFRHSHPTPKQGLLFFRSGLFQIVGGQESLPSWRHESLPPEALWN
jgi:hypothetical protein